MSLVTAVGEAERGPGMQDAVGTKEVWEELVGVSRRN